MTSLRNEHLLIAVLGAAAALLALGCGDGDTETPNAPPTTQTSPLTGLAAVPAPRPLVKTSVDRRRGLRFGIRQQTEDGDPVGRVTLTVSVTSRTPLRTRQEMGAAPGWAIGCTTKTGRDRVFTYPPQTTDGLARIGARVRTTGVRIAPNSDISDELLSCAIVLNNGPGAIASPYAEILLKQAD